MSHFRPRVVLTSTVLAAALASGVLTGVGAQAVTGDAAANGSFAFTARLDIGNGQRACSAALVAPQWLAASAHCFVDDLNASQIAAGKPKLKTTATIGRTDLTTTSGQVREVVELVPRPDRDLVMARLDSPTTGITPVSLAKSAPAAGEELKVAGFGRTKDEWSPLKLHTAVFTVDSVTDSTLAMSGKTAADAICAGDSGAPIVRQRDGKTELVGLASQSWQGGCFGTDPAQTRNSAISTRLDNIAGGNTITAGTILKPGDSLTSNAARLTLQDDGDLVIVSNAGKTLWSTKTAGHPGATARFDANGNLAVIDSDGTTLWESKTTAPGGKAVLQDRGNLVIYSVKSESQWSSGSVVRRDFNGDGRSDMAAWYSYSDGRASIQTATTNADGTFKAPAGSYSAPKGTFSTDHMKFVTGDFNGDGLSDVATVRGYADGSVKLFTWLSKPGGGFADPVVSWSAAAGNWAFDRMTVRAGDFNGDGRDDVAVWYDYADGHDTLFTLTATPQGGFNAPAASWTAATGNWNASRVKVVAGDFNGDGRDDLAALYGYADGHVTLWSFLAKPDGGFNNPAQGWTSTNFGNWDRIHMYAGHFTGGSRDDVAMWYDYADGHDGIHTFVSASKADGTFNAPYQSWNTAAGNYWYENMQVAPGDYNGDGRDDLGAMYFYSDGRAKMLTWLANENGKFNDAVGGWEAAAGNWNKSSATFLGADD
ncbi:FG-GAP-like repeat-containing protein [Streptomyces sp. NPDC001233]